MNDEQYAEIIGALRANEQEHSSYNRRLHEHDEKIDKLQQTQIQLANLTNAVNNLASGIGEVKTSVQDVGKRVAELEREPADKWRKITWEIVKAVVMAAVGAGIAVIVKGA